MNPSFVSQLFPGGNVPILEALARMTYHRQLALQNNLANVNTPYYRRRDVPAAAFHEMLARAIEDRAEKHPGEWELEPALDVDVDANRFPEPRVPQMAERPEPRAHGPLRHDENNVVIEAEMSALMKNTLAAGMYQRLLRSAVQGPLKAIE